MYTMDHVLPIFYGCITSLWYPNSSFGLTMNQFQTVSSCSGGPHHQLRILSTYPTVKSVPALCLKTQNVMNTGSTKLAGTRQSNITSECFQSPLGCSASLDIASRQTNNDVRHFLNIFQKEFGALTPCQLSHTDQLWHDYWKAITFNATEDRYDATAKLYNHLQLKNSGIDCMIEVSTKTDMLSKLTGLKAIMLRCKRSRVLRKKPAGSWSSALFRHTDTLLWSSRAHEGNHLRRHWHEEKISSECKGI